MLKRVDYLCMQPTRQGQASYAHVNEIAEGLRRRGWDLRLVEPPHPRPGRGDGLRRLVAAATTQLAYWIRCRFRPAAFVYIRAHFLTLPSALLARLAGSIVVQEINGPLSDVYGRWPMLRPFHRLLVATMDAQIRWADAVIIVTPGLEDYLRSETGRSEGYFVVGNGANTHLFRPVTRSDDPSDRAYAVFFGALAPWQGLETVLRAAQGTSWPVNVDLVIAGDGVEREQVAAAARACERIRWMGSIPYRDIPAIVAGSLAALVPMSSLPRSGYGLSPLKLFEAMSCGVPVVASDLPGLADIVRAHDCGLIFPAGDPDALGRSVAELAAHGHRAREMGRRGREAAEGYYSWDARAGETEQVLLHAQARRSRRAGAG